MKNEKNDTGNLNTWILFTIILCGLVLYHLPLQSKEFYFDDHISIENNETIRNIDIPGIFNAFNTRFLPGLSFALNYKWCALNPAGYRLVNILIHCLNAFLVYLLIKATLYLYPVRRSAGGNEWPAFFGAMLFLCHPLQTEPVNFITQRFVLMGSFFYLLTLYLYIQYRRQKQKRYLIASMTSAIAAMFCKEFVVTLPFMLALYEFYFLGSLNETLLKKGRRLAPFFIIVLIVPLLLLRTPPEAIGVANIADSDSVQEGDSQRAGSHIDITRARSDISRKQYFLTELNVVRTYVRLLFFPINQNLDYDYPISHGTGKDFLSGLFLLCLLALAAVMYKTYRIVSFGILWFFIALSVESSFIPIGHVIAEYRVYLASIGFVFLVMNLIYMRGADVKKLNIVAAMIIIGLSVLTYQRNKVWQDEFSLWNDTVQKSPHKARPYNNRGLEYYQRGDLSHAMSDYNKAIELDPNDEEAYYNRGLGLYKEGHLAQAVSDYTRAIEINPKYPDAYNNRGGVYYKEGKWAQALSDYSKAIEINPKYALAFYNRGLDLYSQGKLSLAVSDFNRAIGINPKYARAYNNRGVVYYKQGKLTQAMSEYNKAIEIAPNNAEAYYNRGVVHDKQNDLAKAISDYTKTIEINPAHALAYYNRGLGLYKQGKLIQAVSDYNKAITIDPGNAKAYYNRGLALYKQGHLAQAIPDYNKAIELNPAFAEVYNNRGDAYNVQGDLPQAISDYNKAIELNPAYAEAYNNRGIIYGRQGNLSQAIADFTKAIALNPEFAGAYKNRGFTYYNEKEYDKARADMRKAGELGAVVDPYLINKLSIPNKQGL